jgi:hypothetical protein
MSGSLTCSFTDSLHGRRAALLGSGALRSRVRICPGEAVGFVFHAIYPMDEHIAV